MGWPLPIYELALMSAGRAFDMDVELDGHDRDTRGPRRSRSSATTASEAARSAAREREGLGPHLRLRRDPGSRGDLISPGERVLSAQRIVALPELYGPPIRGTPGGEHGFLRVDGTARLHDAGPVYAAGDATDFPIKHGGLAAQQADAVAESIAALAGAAITRRSRSCP